MKKIFSVTLSAVLAVSFAFSAPQVYAANADSKAGIIETAGGNLNVRSAASSGSEIRTSLKKGSYVTLISKSGDWWKVEYSDGKFGFCHSDYITVVSDDTAMVSTKSGNLNCPELRDGKNFRFFSVFVLQCNSPSQEMTS